MNYVTHIQRILLELAIRCFLLTIYLICELIEPFIRIIQPEEIWLYNFPQTASFIPMWSLWILSLTVPLIVIILNYLVTKNFIDLTESLWCFSLLISLNGALTNIIKVLVGRPRPDFVHRCFPDRVYRPNVPCVGEEYIVNNGRKSFPSGHSSVAFASFGFLALYAAAKLSVFTPQGKRSGVRLLAVVGPILFAVIVAISRTCDYHHHWQDVCVGSLLGSLVCLLCYFHFYPSLFNEKCNLPWKQINLQNEDPLLRVKII